MRNSKGTPLDLVGKIYDAALDEKRWPSFLEAFAQAVGGCSSILRSADLQVNYANFVASVGYDSVWQAAYCNHFVKADYVVRALAKFKPGEIKTIDQIISQSEQRKTELYNDYSVPQDKVHALGTFLVKDGSHTLLFSVQRGKRAGDFSDEQARLMGVLAPHVTRAVQVHRKLSSIAVEKEWALGALDQLRMGVILADSLGVPLFINCTAEQMMTQGDGVSFSQGRLALTNPSETGLLHKLIAGAALGAAGGDMRIMLPGGGGYLHCMVTPVSPEFSTRLNKTLGSGCVAIFLSKPGSLELPPKRLALLYGLSPAESRLAAKLAGFNSLEQAAKDLGVAIGTARAQLASVFSKTGARGQAELLMLLATGTLAYCREG